jgi:hypothetical protein
MRIQRTTPRFFFRSIRRPLSEIRMDSRVHHSMPRLPWQASKNVKKTVDKPGPLCYYLLALQRQQVAARP